MTVNRSSRTSCRIPCEIRHGRRRSEATVVDLSERGLGVETTVSIEEGDGVRVRLYPNRGTGSIIVEGIVWSERTQMKARGRSGGQASRVLGLMLSDVPKSFLALIDKLGGQDDRRPAMSASRQAVSRSRVADKQPVSPSVDDDAMRIVHDEPVDSALPRPKSPLPPPKLSEEENLPLFRVRIKQMDGPRTRRIEVRARSSSDVAMRVPELVEGAWEILEIGSIVPRK